MKKRLISTLLVLVLVVCVFPLSAFADNSYADTDYYKDYLSQGEWGGTGGRYKTTTSKVYVVPYSAPNHKTMLKTFCYVNGVITDKTVNPNLVITDTNPETKYAVTNLVYEHGDHSNVGGVYMWLGVAPKLGNGSLSGRWSPDWTGYGNVIIV